MGDSLTFLRAWAADPLRTASVTPSGAALADAITAGIDAGTAPVIELGPGTGVFTAALLARGVPEDRIALVEASGGFADLLAYRFPAARLFRGDASRLNGTALFEGGEKVGAVISGLPLVSMPTRAVVRILTASFERLRPGAAFHQFTYGPTSPVSRAVLARLGLVATRTHRVLLNVPPASVYRIERAG